MPNKLYRHKKTGRVYEVISESGRIEADWSLAVIYKSYGDHDSHLIARPYDEFHDGRFEPMGPAQEVAPFDPLADIAEFHTKFDLDALHPMGALPNDTAKFRYKFLREEMEEWWKHQCAAYDETTRPMFSRDEANYTYHLEEALDGLVDLVYVALGTSYLHGFNFREAWRRVHEANMKKVRAQLDTDSKRGSTLDVVKPAGWEPPSHADLVEENDLGEPHWDRA